MLKESSPDGKGGVELYERGYGKDAAGIAKEAISYGERTPRSCVDHMLNHNY